MSAHEPLASRPSHAAPFRRILCVVDGSLQAAVGLEHAISLAGADATITVTVVWSEGTALGRSAWDVADEAVAQVLAAGATATHRLIKAARPSDALLAAALTHDLVVVGAPAHARTAGIVLGDTATTILHRAQVPVLIARERQLRAGVLAATDGRPSSSPALTAAALIASRLDAPLTVLHVHELDDHERRRHELAAELSNAQALLGRDLHYVTDDGGAAAQIVAAAREPTIGLVVTGSGAKHGVAALSSTSERVAHQAPCSVLVVRGR